MPQSGREVRESVRQDKHGVDCFTVACRSNAEQRFRRGLRLLLLTRMAETFRTYLWVALGGAVGSVARFWVGALVLERFGRTFPWGTLVVNVTGSFAIGLLAVLAGEQSRVSPATRTFVMQFLMVGVCGGYTTFSAFSLQTLNLLQEGRLSWAVANVLASTLVCLAGVWLGWIAGQALNR
jgi:fluoride exporter